MEQKNECQSKAEIPVLSVGLLLFTKRILSEFTFVIKYN